MLGPGFGEQDHESVNFDKADWVGGGVVQSIFIKLLRELPNFHLDHERGRFRTWLYRLVSNEVIDSVRKRKRQAKLAEEVEELRKAEELASTDDSADFAREHHRQVLAFALERVRNESNPLTWQCFEQTALKKRKAADVAEELKLKVTNVHVNASRILAKVRQQCEDYLEPLVENELPSR